MDEGVDQYEDSTYLSSLSDALASSSTKRRTSELSILRQRIVGSGWSPRFMTSPRLTTVVDIPLNWSRTVIRILFTTYPSYNDRTSRRAIQECIKALLTNVFYSTDIQYLISTYTSEASRLGLAPSSSFVLAEWGSILLQYCAGNTSVWDQYGHDIVTSNAQVLDSCLSSKTRSNVKLSALVVTRRALRRLFNNGEEGAEVVRTVVSQLTANTNPLGLRSAVFLGVIAGVCARLSSRKATLKVIKDQFYSYYVREVIGSRSIVPQYTIDAFNDFFSNFATLADLEASVIPALEKALLRAPEVVLNDLVSHLVTSLPPTIDLAQTTFNHLLKPLLSNVKSQNSLIRDGAVSAFGALIGRSYDQEYIQKITDNILIPLSTSKVAVAEQRMLYAKMLSLIRLPPPRSKAVCDGLLSTLSKEPNELALAAEVLAFTKHFSYLLLTGSESLSSSGTSIIEAYVRGLADRRPAFRKIWAMNAGELLWQLKCLPKMGDVAIKFIDAILPKLLEIFDEVTMNLHSAGPASLIISAYILIAVCSFASKKISNEKLRISIQKMKVFDRAMSSNPKQSVLLNHRTYSKLSMKEEYLWMTRALEVCSYHLPSATELSSINDAWAQAFIYLIVAENVPTDIQKKAQDALTSSYIASPLTVASSVIRGLWTWHRNLEITERDAAALVSRTGNSRLHLVVNSICLPYSKARSPDLSIEKSILQDQLIDMLVLCRPEILPRVTWIDICLRVGQDPGLLVKSKANQCLKKVDEYISIDESVRSLVSIQRAAYNTAADLAFVAPETIIPSLVEKIQHDLSAEALQSYGPTEIAISRTPEGMLFVDVLDKKAQNSNVYKNSRDYDTIKWEDEIRTQVAQKKGQEKKLMPDEKAKVNAQLIKEAAIRREVNLVQSKLKRGIGVLNALIMGPPTEINLWMSKSLKYLIEIIAGGAGHIVGDAADMAYINCANLTSSRLGSLKQFIGIATLRSLGFSNLPQHFTHESLGGQCIYSVEKLVHYAN